VALKFVEVDNGRGEQEQNSLKLLRESQHPSLITIFGTWYGEKWLVVAMELAERTLQDRLKEAVNTAAPGIPFEELLAYMMTVAEGLDFLNDSRPDGKHLHHGDIKPHNLLLVSGRVKIADFGLMRMTSRSVTDYSGARTDAYAAPEFYKSKSSRNSDQYSLAITYCELRGGRLPFEGKNSAEWAGAHLYHAPDLTMLPDDERPAVARALAKDPHDRWPSCMEFVWAVQRKIAGTVPNGAPSTADNKRLQVEGWADRFVPRLGRELRDSWSSLADALREKVADLSPDQVARPKDASLEKWIAAPVESWFRRFVQPILDDGNRELMQLAGADLTRQATGAVESAPRPMMLPADVFTGGNAAGSALITTVEGLVFTNVGAHWPALIARHVPGKLLSLFGLTDPMGLRKRLQTGFEEKLLPAIQEAVVGAGVQYEGRRYPSLLEQLQHQVLKTADRVMESNERSS
jgi:hypothetical protein